MRKYGYESLNILKGYFRDLSEVKRRSVYCRLKEIADESNPEIKREIVKVLLGQHKDNKNVAFLYEILSGYPLYFDTEAKKQLIEYLEKAIANNDSSVKYLIKLAGIANAIEAKPMLEKYAEEESEKDMANLRVVGVKSVSAADITSDSDTEPKTAYVAVGDSVTVAALPEPSGDWPDSKPTWAGATAEDGSASADFSTDAASATASGTAVTATCGSSSKSINVVVVGVKSVSAEGVTSTTNSPGANETVYVPVSANDTVTITAAPEPDGNWPDNQPTWDGAVDEEIGTSVTFSNFDSAGEYKVTANCGTSSTAINITVVGVKSVSASAYGQTITSTTNSPGNDESICIDGNMTGTPGSIAVTATFEPVDNAPDNQPEWYVDSTKVQTGGSSYTFSAENRGIGAYNVSAKCGTSEKAIKIYIVNCKYTLVVDEPIPGTSYPFSTFSYENGILLWSVGHAVWEIRVSPNAARNAVPFKNFSNIINTYLGFNPTNRPLVARTGVSDGNTVVGDTLSSLDKYRISNITVANAKVALNDSLSKVNNPPNYIGAQYFSFLYVLVSWEFEIDNNCLTVARNVGVGSGVDLPSGEDQWIGTIWGQDCIYWGNAPGFIGPRL